MAKQQFILINSDRIRISTIRRYRPLGDLSIVIRFSSNPDNKQAETFKFEDVEDRDQAIENLDRNCLM
jgi:hypothetical protein